MFVIPAKAGIHSAIRSRTSISDTYKLLDSRFRGNDNYLRDHHILLKIIQVSSSFRHFNLRNPRFFCRIVPMAGSCRDSMSGSADQLL